MNNPINDWINSTIQGWLSDHPMTGWFMTHPLASFIVVVLGLILFWGLLGFIGNSAQKLWGLILSAPIKMIQTGIQQVLKIRPQEPESGVQEIIQQLQDLHQQEVELLNKLKAQLPK